MTGGPGVPGLPPEDHRCPECGFSYPATTTERALADVARLPAALRAELARLPDDRLRRRPSPDGWSIVEYVCHLRDVHVASTIRLHRALTEDRPAVEPMLNDLRAKRFRYRERDVGATLDELAAAVSGFQDEARGVRSARDWDRQVTRLPGEARSARWLVRHAAHEGRHHLLDVTALARTGGSA